MDKPIKVYKIGKDLIVALNEEEAVRYFETETGEKAEKTVEFSLNDEVVSIIQDMCQDGIQFPAWLGYTRE